LAVVLTREPNLISSTARHAIDGRIDQLDAH
jgi:hypothetical protein